MVTLTKYGAKYNRLVLNIEGLSTDTPKPTVFFYEYDDNGALIAKTPIQNGSIYTEIDTGDTYMYDVDNTTWHKVSIGGGGGGGTQGGIILVGETTTQLVDNATTNPITVDGQSYTAQPNDAVIYGNKEFLFDGTKWHEFGDLSGLASKDIGAMTNYVIAQTGAAINTSDTLNQAIGKVEKRVSDNETNILSSQQKIHNIGMNNMSVLLLGNFAVGGLNTDGGLRPEVTYRVSSTDIIKFETDTLIIIQEGFKCGYIPFVGGTAGTWSDWKTGSFTILAGTALKFQIARINEQTETALIVEFTNAIKIGFIASDNDFGKINYYNGTIGNDGKDGDPSVKPIRLRTNYIDVSKVRSIAMSIDSMYAYGVHTYNNEYETIYNSPNWVYNNTTLDISNASYIRFNFRKVNNANISPADAPNMQFVALDVNDFSEGEYAPYYGNINLGRKYSAKKYLGGYTPQTALPSTTQQGMSIYNGYAFLLYDKGGLVIYDLLHKTAVAEITLASASADNHVNSANFSTEFASGGIYPLLYISECYGQHRCFVENITNSGSTLVQTISFTNTNGDYTNSTYNNAFDWILDNDTGLLMTYGVMSDGKHKIKTFAKPSTASATVELTEADVIDQWIIEDYIYPISSTNWIYQGNCAKGGTIYIPTYRPNSIICINETTHEVTARVTTTFDNGEPEDVAVWADNLFTVYLGSKIYALSFK